MEEENKCLSCSCCSGGEPRGKSSCCNYLADVPGKMADYDLVEVTFKNTRKGFYRNSQHLELHMGDMVAVEAQPGHDIGKISLVGKLVELQMKRAGVKADMEIKRVFRIAKEADLEKYNEVRALEHDTMIQSRGIAESLNLNMKIGDVEYQGDGSKAIFYYIADERVDFRQLIRVLADKFKIRIEMRQIGARQEAGRIGGIGSCGRALCCSMWMSNFMSVGTNAARYQDLSLNPTKLAGQCGKLKCCLNFEMDAYMEAVKKMPPRDAHPETKEKTYYQFKSDVFKQEITYSTSRNSATDLVTIPAQRAFEILEMNAKGEKPDTLAIVTEADKKAVKKDLLEQDSLTRFDKKKKKKRKSGNSSGQNNDKSGQNVNNRRNRGKNNKSDAPTKESPKPQTTE